MLNNYNELLIHIDKSFLVSLQSEFVSVPLASVTRLRQQELNSSSFF